MTKTYHQNQWSVEVGDIVFILMGTAPFRKLARDTGTWTNHVGIVIDTSGHEPLVAESKFPFSIVTPLSTFLARSKKGQVAIKRVHSPSLTPDEQNKIKHAAEGRIGIFYDIWFNIHSKRQFCSRFVYEVMQEATGRKLGSIENLRDLLAKNPQATVWFWRLWYLGKIPWQLETITPASLLQDEQTYTLAFPQQSLETNAIGL